MRFVVFVLFLFTAYSSFGQYKLYEEGIKRYNEKKYYEAIEQFSDYLTKPLRDKKFDADSYYWRGLSYFKLNDFPAASEDLKQSLSLNHPNKGNIHWFLAKSLNGQNDYAGAVKEYDQALKALESDKTSQTQILAERAQALAQINGTNKPGNVTTTPATSTADAGKATQKTPALEQPKKETPSPKITEKKEPQTQPASTTGNSSNDAIDRMIQQRMAGGNANKPVNNNPVANSTPKKDEPKKDDKKQPAVDTRTTETKKQTVQQPVATTPVVSTPAVASLTEMYKGEKRYALVIGNSAYSKSIGVLKNPVNDATDFAASLQKLGFEVTLITNASYGKTRAEMMKFRDKLNQGEKDQTVGLFYYAGHGLQSDDENYIVPVDAELQYQDDIARYCFPIQKMVLTQMENTNSRMNIVILDACRNNPYPSLTRGAGDGQGLGEMKKARGAFIAYATSPGSVASDGSGRNGLYTQELIKAMNKPGKTIEQVFKEVRASVLKHSGDRQNPWENSNIVGDFYFKLD